MNFREDASAAATFGDSEMAMVDVDETLTEEERGVAQYWALEEVGIVTTHLSVST